MSVTLQVVSAQVLWLWFEVGMCHIDHLSCTSTAAAGASPALGETTGTGGSASVVTAMPGALRHTVECSKKLGMLIHNTQQCKVINSTAKRLARQGIVGPHPGMSATE